MLLGTIQFLIRWGQRNEGGWEHPHDKEMIGQVVNHCYKNNYIVFCCTMLCFTFYLIVKGDKSNS
jgi:hypothetical protein